MAKIIKLCNLRDLPESGTAGFTLKAADKELNVFVIRKDGQIHVYENRCPHTGVNLDWQPHQFLDSTQSYIQCSTHGARFRIEDGYCIYGPCVGDSLKPIDCQLTDGQVEIIVV